MNRRRVLARFRSEAVVEPGVIGECGSWWKPLGRLDLGEAVTALDPVPFGRTELAVLAAVDDEFPGDARLAFYHA